MFQKEEQRYAARQLYMQTNKTYSEIAGEVGVTKRTIINWAKQGDWNTIRFSLRDTSDNQVEYLYAELGTINRAIARREPGQRFPTAEEAAVRHKIISSINELKKRVGIADNIDAFMGFLSYLNDRDHDLGKLFTREVDNYFKTVVFKTRS